MNKIFVGALITDHLENSLGITILLEPSERLKVSIQCNNMVATITM